MSGIVLTYTASGRNGKTTVTATHNGEPLAVELVNLAKATERTTFARALVEKRPEVLAKNVEAELLKFAAELASKPETPAADVGSLPELDVSAIIRPERAITPEVSTVAIPTMSTCGDRVLGRWQLYLRWADGRRERRALGPVLELPEGGRLFIHPEPGEPSPNMRPGWSAAARRRWLDGEPAPRPVDVFKGLAERFAYFVDLPQALAPGIVATLVSWTVLTYIYPVFGAVPYLYVGGPLGSGKSRVFEVLARLVFRPLGASNMTAASLFRTLHSQGGCLLLDEAERLRNTKDPDVGETLSMLLAGYKRGGCALRLEPLGDSGFRTVSFDVFGCKALACIAGLPPALASRAIGLTMFRAAPGSEKPRRRIDGDPAGWQRLRDDLHALALEHGSTWLALPKQTDVCPAMSGRDFELWQPLLSLGAWLEEHGAGGLLALMQAHAMQTIDGGRDEQTPDQDETLLRLLAERRTNLETPQAREILEAARTLDAVTFRQWTPKGVSNVFRRYGVTTKEIHGRKVYRTEIVDLLRIQETYGLSLGLERLDRPEG
jgi:hypothetical protein